MAHEKLTEAGGEAQKQLLLVRLDLVLTGGETIQVLLEGGVLHVVHDGGLHLHSSHVLGLLQNEVLQKALDHAAFGVVAHVSRIGARFVVHQLQASHQLYMRRHPVHCPGLGDLIVGELLEVLVAGEVELVCIYQIAVLVQHLPVGDCLGFGLESLGDHLPLPQPDGAG